MGVKYLWDILESVKDRDDTLESLKGKALAVDLSNWICEALPLSGTVSKPYLRNIFFRSVFLRANNVKLVFVVDGQPPEIKSKAIIQRCERSPSANSGFIHMPGPNPGNFSHDVTRGIRKAPIQRNGLQVTSDEVKFIH